MRITEQDREEMRLRGLPPIPEHYLRRAREILAWRSPEQPGLVPRWMQPDAGLVRWYLEEDRRVEELEEYGSDPGLTTDDTSDLAFDLPGLISISPRGPSPSVDILHPETENVNISLENIEHYSPLAVQGPLNEAIRSEESGEYTSDPGFTTNDTSDLSSDLPDLIPVPPRDPSPPVEILYPETVDANIASWNIESTPPLTRQPSAENSRPVTPTQLQEPRDAVQTVGSDDMNYRDEPRDAAQTVISDNARFGDEGYQSLTSSVLETEDEKAEVDGEKK